MSLIFNNPGEVKLQKTKLCHSMFLLRAITILLVQLENFLHQNTACSRINYGISNIRFARVSEQNRMEKKRMCFMKPRNLCCPQQHACALASIVTMYTTEERIFLLASFIETKSYGQVQRAFLAHFKCSYRKKPSRRVIQCLIQKFYAAGSVLDDKGKVGAKRTVRKEKKKEACALIKENPQASLTCLAQQLGVSKTMTYHILREDIGLFPYKVHIVQKLSAFNKAKCLQFAEEFGV